MVNRHAYLIIAHNEFEVLQSLILALDDSRNDIFIHIDSKVEKLPSLTALHSKIFLLENRIDVRWGHVSQIACEYALFEKAYNTSNNYSRYHLISGTHLPLKTQDFIHKFFEAYPDKDFYCTLYTNAYEINFKLGYYHLFLKNYRTVNKLREILNQFVWHLLIKLQQKLKIYRYTSDFFEKANNWVSLQPNAVDYLIKNKKTALNRFRFTFCGDEFFVPYILRQNQQLSRNLKNESRLLFNEFDGSNPRILKNSDFDFLINSDYLFARKFSFTHMELVYNIVYNLIGSK